MAIQLFGNKELSVAKKWCAEYSLSAQQTDIILKAVQQGYSADEAIKVGCRWHKAQEETVRTINDTMWANLSVRSDRGR